MKLSLSSLVILTLSFSMVSCSTEERDGRQYHGSGGNPVQGRMGVQYKRMRSAAGEPARTDDGSLFGSSNSTEPPGLLDRNETPDEPGVKYRIKAQQSPNPAQSRMGVRVSREKITE
ncbi:hypothetical protein SAMN02745166_02904 [Prosthecobacter debontii]|uniref:Secreted protein n=1 Tax=Prosthecobacter debontii TaxID=48467 RepID=A0A1T4YBV3_9BACT|nr:hypothetical protein [Prosthecobacter debontii]SKA99317.1 hypothetical protein SAMN02745166_02904 [Prosthecobacter debontii]